MNKKAKAIEIRSILDSLYPELPIPLQHKDAYTLLIAVLLSAQCTDDRVNKISPQLFAIADNPEDMSKLDVQQIEEIIKPCGLFQKKARAIKELSRILVEDYNGHVPDTLEALEKLPGVGRKTASVVLIQAFGKPAFPVDTHIHRLAQRWGLSSGKNVSKTEEDLKKVFPESIWEKIHLQMIYYGRAYCPARGHSLDHCIICKKLSKK